MSQIALFVRVPDDGRTQAGAIARADQTAQIFSATFTCPSGTYLAEPDGTYKVVAPVETASMVRRALEQNERLIVEREEPIN